MIAVVLPLATLALGAGLGFVSSIVLESRRQANGIATKIIEGYLELRKELCAEVATLASLRVGAAPAVEDLAAKQDAISHLYYRFYDFTPKRVLQELNCLYACLGDRENRIYVIRDDNLRLADEAETAALIQEISLLGNFKHYALLPLASSDPMIRRAASINYQARRVLHVINQDLNIRALHRWSRSPRKAISGRRQRGSL
ncbi:hypothetical protein SMC26_14285 [Actinomadura fulvescens]|uniref:Uncharacterized protein n=1 Tax=Actinomadura fulvescens TaxID=46160 RepID=A0ABP6CGM8_9ACTN